MEKSARFAVACVAVSLLLSCQPAEAWYKQSTGPTYYSVGRASGLLSGIRRSPFVRRSESEEALLDGDEAQGNNNAVPEGSRQISLLKSMVSGHLVHSSTRAPIFFVMTLKKDKTHREVRVKDHFIKHPKHVECGS